MWRGCGHVLVLVTNRLLPIGQVQERDMTNPLALPNATFRHLGRVGSFMWLQNLNDYTIVRIRRGCGRVLVLVTNRLLPVGRGQKRNMATPLALPNSIFRQLGRVGSFM